MYVMCLWVCLCFESVCFLCVFCVSSVSIRYVFVVCVSCLLLSMRCVYAVWVLLEMCVSAVLFLGEYSVFCV